MKIGIIGAGFTGLTAAYELSKMGHSVEVCEKDVLPGGLAGGFKDKKWTWELEKHYHHLFVSDTSIRKLAAAIGHPIIFFRPQTSTLVNSTITQLDSPISLLKFKHLPLIDRLRTALGLALLRFNPFWQPLESITAEKFINFFMGVKSWEVLWRPLFKGKFGENASEISASWFWSRIYKRSASLGYPKGGFLSLAKSIEKAAKSYGAKFIYNSTIDDITKFAKKYDRVICTLPTPAFSRISGIKYPLLKGLGAINVVISLKHQLLSDHSYWLNINDPGYPFLALVEHTNYMDPKLYNNDHVVYLGNYLDPKHRYFSMTAEQILAEFKPYLLKINPSFKSSWVKHVWAWKSEFAQPIMTTGYSKLIPEIKTSLPNVYLANIQQVYPWDRGTNYAVELGIKVALLCINN